MTESTYEGIPRTKIPWYPTINYKKCKSCGKCAEFCKQGVYEVKFQKDKTKKTIVKNPYRCVVLCSGCDDICKEGAIKHPSKDDAIKKIEKLKRKYSARE